MTTRAASSSAANLKANTGEVNLLSAAEPEEAAAYQKIFDDLINSNADYKATVESSADLRRRSSRSVPTVARSTSPRCRSPAPSPASSTRETSSRSRTSGSTSTTSTSSSATAFVALGEYKGKHYGLPTNINLKSMVWYPKKAFDAAGYTVPKTWDEMLALSDKIVADGSTPWCVGFESGGATGWPATDWMEDIMLRTAGTDTYDKWWKHEIPFNDPAVQHAGQLFGDVMFHEGLRPRWRRCDG